MAIDVVNNAKVVATKNNYRDLDLLFKAHPITGDVTTRSDVEAVKRSVKNIILTNNYERPFKPGFGGSIRDLLLMIQFLPTLALAFTTAPCIIIVPSPICVCFET